MATKCNINSQTLMPRGNDRVITLEKYEPNIGAPFKVTLMNSVKQSYSADGELLETSIPNLSGLLKEIAFARSLDQRKFSPEDIKFVRKAVGLKGLDLAELLGISAEHLSRCENGERTLSVAAEKLLRVIILKRRHNPAELATLLEKALTSSEICSDKIDEIKSLIQKYKTTVEEIETAIFDFRILTVHDAGDDLEFSFHLVHHSQSKPPIEPDKHECWEREAA